MIKSICTLLKRYGKEEDGATAVEFSLIAIPFFLFIIGIMEAGRTVWALNGVQYAVEETGRYASLNSELPDGSYETYAVDKLDDMMVDSDNLGVNTTRTTSSGLDFIELDASYTHETIFTWLPNDFGRLEFNVSVKKPVIN